MSTKKGRKILRQARVLVIEELQRHPKGLHFYKLWTKVRASGISKGLFVKVLRELTENEQILRQEREKTVITVTYRVNSKSDIGHLLTSQAPRGNHHGETGGFDI